MAITAPSAAPLETPSKAGSASGLRVKPCSTAPDRPNVAPTIKASTLRGRRTSCTISPARVSCAEKIASGGSHTRPASSEAAKAITISSTSDKFSFIAVPLAVRFAAAVQFRHFPAHRSYRARNK